MEKSGSTTNTHPIDRLISWVRQASDGFKSSPLHILVKAIRKRLGMTQSQLAKRVGLPQSHIAKIESGHVDPQLSTIKKIFESLYCEIVVVPKFRKSLDDIVEEKTHEVARKKVVRLLGMLTLKGANDKTVQDMIRSEELKLNQHPSEMWNSEDE